MDAKPISHKYRPSNGTEGDVDMQGVPFKAAWESWLYCTDKAKFDRDIALCTAIMTYLQHTAAKCTCKDVKGRVWSCDCPLHGAEAFPAKDGAACPSAIPATFLDGHDESDPAWILYDRLTFAATNILALNYERIDAAKEAYEALQHLRKHSPASVDMKGLEEALRAKVYETDCDGRFQPWEVIDWEDVLDIIRTAFKGVGL